MEKSNKKNYTVDLIKFIAAVMVIFSHSFSLSNSTKDYLARWIDGASFGSFAVSIFFCFSGYYITKSILKNSEKFLFKRLKRLLPELILVTLITIAVVGPIFTNLSLKDYFTNKQTYLFLLNAIMIPYHNLPGVFIDNVSLRTVNGSLWTLMVEFLCYIFIYIIYKMKLLNKNKISIVLFFSLFFSLVGFLVIKKLEIDILLSMIRPFLIFIFSSFLYFYKNMITKNIFNISFLISIILLLFRNYILYDIFLIILIPIILCYISENIFIKNKKISYFGKISYSMYLTGFVIQQSIISVFGGKMNSYLNFLFSLPICIISAIIINIVINKIIKKISKEVKL